MYQVASLRKVLSMVFCRPLSVEDFRNDFCRHENLLILEPPPDHLHMGRRAINCPGVI
jgi:hypothetical protein